MTEIILITRIKASQQKCFDTARDAGAHLHSMGHTGERVVAGRSAGLFELHDEVTWEAVHLGVKQKLSTRITAFGEPDFFEDTMLKGAFKSMRHGHYFKSAGDFTLMKDVFRYETPLGAAGRLFDRIYLRSYMKKLLEQRNAFIKAIAEAD